MAQPMEVEAFNIEDEAAIGLDIYHRLLRATFKALDLEVDGLLDIRKQLDIYQSAARLFELRESILKLLRDGIADEVLPQAFEIATLEVRSQLLSSGSLPSSSVLRGKRIFGHRSTVKFISLPNLPSSTHVHSIFVAKRFLQDSSFSSPLEYLENASSSLVLTLDSILEGAVVIISPLLNKTSDSLAISEMEGHGAALKALLSRDAEAWRRLVRTEQDLFTELSGRFLRQALNVQASKAVTRPSISGATTTPQKPPRASAASEANATGDDFESPPKSSQAVAEAGSASKQDGEESCQRAYSLLLESLFEEMDYFADADKDWLDIKKQLLVYHHAARLNEERDAVAAALRCDEEHAAGLQVTHRKAVDAVRDDVLSALAVESQKAKKIFSHDHVIKFHQVKGLPISRTSCIFLRERPQSTSDILRKTPSIFRDLVRFRCQGSPLGQLEDRGLALVFTVTDKTPRAFLVVSPLFEDPQAVEKVMHNTWGEIETALREHLVNLIAKESDAWRAFIQRHANIVSKDSLKTIQKVLKSCPSICGPSTFRFSEDLEEALEEAMRARELASMSQADLEIQLAVTSEALENQTEGAAKAKTKAKERLEKAKRKASEAEAAIKEAEAEARSTKQKLTEEKDALAVQLSQLNHDRDEAKERMVRQQKSLQASEEEVFGLSDANQELLTALAEAQDLANKRKEKLQAQKNLLQQAQQMTRAASADRDRQLMDFASFRREASEKAAELERRVSFFEASLAEARTLAAKTQAELELKADSLQRLTEVNVSLRTEAAKSSEALTSAQKEASKAKEHQCKTLSELEGCTKELLHASSSLKRLQVEANEAVARASAADEKLQKSEGEITRLNSVATKLRAEIKAKSNEAECLTTLCTSLRSDLSKASSRAELAEQSVREHQQQLVEAKAEIDIKADTISQLSTSNASLRLESLAAKDREGIALERESMALKNEAAAKAAMSALEDKLKAQSEELKQLNGFNEILRKEAQRHLEALDDAKAQMTKAQEAADKALNSERSTAAKLQAAVAESAHLTASYTALLSEMSRVKEEAQRDLEKAATATKMASEAKQAQLQAQAQLEVRETAFAQLQASNASLRTDIIEAKEATAQAQRKCNKAEEAARLSAKSEALAVSEAETSKRLATEAQKKASELEAGANQLKSERDSAIAGAEKAGEAQKAAEKVAEEARRSERKAKAQLKVKANEAHRLSEACVALRGEVAKASVRAKEAERLANEAIAERQVALSASDLTEADVRRLASRGGIIRPRGCQVVEAVEEMSTTVESAAVEQVPDIEADLAAALDLQSPQKPSEPQHVAEDVTEPPLWQDVWTSVEANIKEKKQQRRVRKAVAKITSPLKRKARSLDPNKETQPGIATSQALLQQIPVVRRISGKRAQSLPLLRRVRGKRSEAAARGITA
jgi:hypothetical protein